MVQLTCIIILTIDFLIRIYSHDQDLRQSQWTKLFIVALIMDYLRLILVALAISDLQSIILLLQCFRPYYLVYSARSLRSVVKAVLRSMPKIFDFVWIIAIVVFIFGIIGYELFHDINPKFFGTKETALFSLMVTLTTANFPDVMMAGYAYSEYTVIYFTLYVIIIIIILLPTILAVVYQAYHTQTQLQFATVQKLQTEALRQAFDVLTAHLAPIKRNRYNKYARYDQQHGNNDIEQVTVSLTSFVDILKHLRPDLNLQHCQVLYTTLRLDEELILKSPLETEHILLSRKPGLTLNEWFKLPEFLEVKFEIAPTATIAHQLITLQAKVDNEMDTYLHKRTFWNKCKSSMYKFRIFMLFIFTSPITDNIIDWIVWLNTMIILSLNWYYVANDLRNWMPLQYVLDVVCCLFVVEMGLKIYSYGVKAFFNHTFLVCDLILVLITVFVSVYIGPIHDRDNYVTLLRGIRLLRISRQFPRMRLIFRFFASLSRAFFILLLTMFCLFYVFAMIGMVLFGGDVSKENVEFRYREAVDNNDMEMEAYWMGVINTYYYLNNMNDFFHSMVTLMELAIVNNWQVVSGTFIAMKQNDYYRVYFIVFYFFAVILLLNIIVAFVLDIFITQYSKNFSENSLLYRYKKYVMMSILIHQLQDSGQDFDLLHWHITRRVRPALLMQTLFEDNQANAAQTQHQQHPQHHNRPSNQSNLSYNSYQQSVDDSRFENRNTAKSSPSKMSKMSKLSKHSIMSRFSSKRSVFDSMGPNQFKSTVSLKPQPTMSSMSSMMVLPNSMKSSSSSHFSLLSKEEMINLRESINYDDLQQMPWGQESLTQEFLHIYGNDRYYKQKHQLLNRNFAEVTQIDVLTKQTSLINSINSQYTFNDNINDFYKFRSSQADILHEDKEDDDDDDDYDYDYDDDKKHDEEDDHKQRELNKLHMVYSKYFDKEYIENDDGFTAEIGNFEPIV